MSDPNAVPHEYETAHLKKLAQVAYREAGLIIEPGKFAMVQSRLRNRLTALNSETFEDYCEFVCSEQGQTERKHLISALTTNVSGFFREQHHFDILQSDIFPNVIPRLKNGGRVRFWSAGCSTGQEPFSIAMLALETDPIFASGDFKILASDIDPVVLKTCRSGIYSNAQMESLDKDRKQRFFEDHSAIESRTRQSLQELISFRELNLLANWPMKGQFDVIMCRNVVIYFDGKTQKKLWPRFNAQLADDGWLFVGHSERIGAAQDSNFKTVGPTAYQKIEPSGSFSQMKKGE